MIEGLTLGSTDAGDAILLVLTEPGFAGLAEHATGEEVDNEAEDDADECDGVEKVHGVAEDVDANDGAPEVAC